MAWLSLLSFQKLACVSGAFAVALGAYGAHAPSLNKESAKKYKELLCGWSKPGEIIWKISSRWWTYVYGWMACVCLLNAQILNDWISLKNYPCFSFLCFFISVFIRRKCQYIISHKVNKVNAILSAT
ncbi:uncharacterized protein LOC141891492 isoform X1 [Acropora palmata]|uniref:uncharacterized protein LOC141891492 isoform X1 n=1 Tax=Acropora palmata TaxID=6131 RepID=UPI003DA11347